MTATKHRESSALELESVTLTYADTELEQRANALGRGLREHGVKTEDRVALIHSNTPEYVVSDLATVEAGGTIVPVNEIVTQNEIRYILSDADAQALVCGPEFIQMAASFVADLPELSICYGVGDPESLPDGVASFNHAVAHGSTDPLAASVPSGDIAAHFYTSGTTGKPKGIVHTHRSQVLNLYANGMELDVSEHDRRLLMTPLTH